LKFLITIINLINNQLPNPDFQLVIWYWPLIENWSLAIEWSLEIGHWKFLE